MSGAQHVYASLGNQKIDLLVNLQMNQVYNHFLNSMVSVVQHACISLGTAECVIFGRVFRFQ